MKKIDEEVYKKSFIESSVFPNKAEEIHKKAYEIANENRKFEIENYWKRANYYWLFQVSIFTGYFYCTIKDNEEYLNSNQEIIVGITFLGFLTALAWFLANKGSKQWQNNWENHVYRLEESITGPLYKTTSNETTWSVSRINELVSLFFVIAWILLGIKSAYMFFNCTALIIYSFILVLIWLAFMLYCKGLGHQKQITFFRIENDTKFQKEMNK